MTRGTFLLTTVLAAGSTLWSGQPVIKIDSDRQLFVDELLIARQQGVTLQLHSPIPREVALAMEEPWEQEDLSSPVVMKDGSRYRMWYSVWHSIGEEERALGLRRTGHVRKGVRYTGYAESKDGIHWHRPILGLHDFMGSRNNNLVWAGPGDHISVLKDANPGVPEDERYKAVTRARGAYGLVSGDGIRWRLIQEEPILSGGAFDSHNTVSQDPWTGEYVYYGRGFLDRSSKKQWDRQAGDRRNLVRRIRRASSKDFRSWSALEFIDLGPEPLDHLYTNAATPYLRARGLYLIFPMRFVPERKFHQDWPYQGLSDVVFASSRDGVHWKRTFLGAFLRPGLDSRNWHERAIIQGQGLVETGPGELSLYWVENKRTDGCRIRRGTIRTDGFVSVNAGYEGGEFLTPLLTFKGEHLWLNYSTSAVGWLKLEIQDVAGRPISGFGLDESQEIFGDELERKAHWISGSQVGQLQGRPVRLRFKMKDADLFSFRFGGRTSDPPTSNGSLRQPERIETGFTEDEAQPHLLARQRTQIFSGLPR